MAAKPWKYFPLNGITDASWRLAQKTPGVGVCTCGKDCGSSRGKHPRHKNWQQEATSDQRQVSAWRQATNPTNLGILCGKESDLLVLDVDAGGEDTLAKLEEKYSKIPETRRVKTGNGFQLYFSYTPGLQNAVKPVPGLDIRTDGGLVVAAGSRHYKGNVYTTVVDVPPVQMPQWLFDELRVGQGEKASPPVASAAVTSIGEGSRNASLTQLAGKLRRNGLSPEIIRVTLAAYNQKYCNPPLPQSEIATISNSIGSKPSEADASTWPDMFPALSDCDFPEFRKIIEEILIEGGIHVFAGLFESYKTMFAMMLCAALINKIPVSEYFQVNSSHDVLFLCPDMPGSLFNKYAALFGLNSKDKVETHFRVLHPKAETLPDLEDPRLQAAVRGRVLVLDTMLDFARIKEAGKSDEWIEFMQKLRNLINIHGCVAIVLIAHPTKEGARSSDVEATLFLKDSVTFGGKIDVGFAFCSIKKTTKIFVQRIKGRGFEKPITFTIATHDEQGNSYLSQGRFPISDKPGEAGKRSDHDSGRKSKLTDEVKAKLVELVKAGKSEREIAEILAVSHTTVQNWTEKIQDLFSSAVKEPF
jgi:hypothetical protein